MKIRCSICNSKKTKNTYSSRIKPATEFNIIEYIEIWYCKKCDDFFEVDRIDR